MAAAAPQATGSIHCLWEGFHKGKGHILSALISARNYTRTQQLTSDPQPWMACHTPSCPASHSCHCCPCRPRAPSLSASCALLSCCEVQSYRSWRSPPSSPTLMTPFISLLSHPDSLPLLVPSTTSVVQPGLVEDCHVVHTGTTEHIKCGKKWRRLSEHTCWVWTELPHQRDSARFLWLQATRNPSSGASAVHPHCPLTQVSAPAAHSVSAAAPPWLTLPVLATRISVATDLSLVDCSCLCSHACLNTWETLTCARHVAL